MSNIIQRMLEHGAPGWSDKLSVDVAVPWGIFILEEPGEASVLLAQYLSGVIAKAVRVSLESACPAAFKKIKRYWECKRLLEDMTVPRSEGTDVVDVKTPTFNLEQGLKLLNERRELASDLLGNMTDLALWRDLDATEAALRAAVDPG